MTQTILFSNNATSRLLYDTSKVSSTVTVETGLGALFPQPSGDYFFMLTLEDRRLDRLEICKCTARHGDVMTVVRGQEGTAAQDFLAGATVSNRLTAGTLIAFQDHVNNAAGYEKTEADERFVNVDGDTMTGDLLLARTGSLPLHAINRGYVDTELAKKAALAHTHPISDIVNLQTALNLKIEEAPLNNTPYARQQGTWVISITRTTYDAGIATITGEIMRLDDRIDALETRVVAVENEGIEDVPMDGTPYVRQDKDWHRLPPAYSGVIISDLPPTVQYQGYLWWDSNSGIMYLRYHDADSQQWIQVNNPPAMGSGTPGGGGGGGIPEAPADGRNYTRRGADASWQVAGTATVSWDSILGKPDTFPPTLPIPSSGVTGLDAAQAAQDAAIAGKEPAIATGDPVYYWAGDKTWKQLPAIPAPVNAYTKAESDAKYEPTITTGDPNHFWAGNKTWKAVPESGITQAVADTLYVNVTGDTMTGNLQVPAGAAATPGIAVGAANTGLTGSATTLNISIGGSSRFLMDTSKFTPTLPLRAFDGSATAPSYSFNSGSNLGMYRIGADQLGFSVGGTLKLTMAAAALTATVPIALPADPASALHAAPKQYVDTKEPALPAGGTTAQYLRGDKTWQTMPSGGGATIGDAPPVTPTNGQFWWESDSGGLYLSYNDGNTQQWVQVNMTVDTTALVKKSGDTMTGFLTLHANPISGMQAATKNYVDSIGGSYATISYVDTELAKKANLTGAAFTGAISGTTGAFSSSVTAPNLWTNANFNPASYAPVGGVPGSFSAGAGLTGSAAAYSVTGVSPVTGGVLGYDVGNGVYGVVGYGGYGLYTPYSLQAQGASVIFGGLPTTANASSCHISNPEGNRVYRFNSSAANKTQIEPIQDEYGDKILDLKPVFFRSLNEADDPTWSWFGFTAEDVAAVDFRFCMYTKRRATNDNGELLFEQIPLPEIQPDGTIINKPGNGLPIFTDELVPDAYNINGIVAALVQLVQRQDATIKSLVARVDALEAV
jgi:hypothetical protein